MRNNRVLAGLVFALFAILIILGMIPPQHTFADQQPITTAALDCSKPTDQESHLPTTDYWVPKGEERIVHFYAPGQPERKLLLTTNDKVGLWGGGSNWYYPRICRATVKDIFNTDKMPEVTLATLRQEGVVVDLGPTPTPTQPAGATVTPTIKSTSPTATPTPNQGYDPVAAKTLVDNSSSLSSLITALDKVCDDAATFQACRMSGTPGWTVGPNTLIWTNLVVSPTLLSGGPALESRDYTPLKIEGTQGVYLFTSGVTMQTSGRGLKLAGSYGVPLPTPTVTNTPTNTPILPTATPVPPSPTPTTMSRIYIPRLVRDYLPAPTEMTRRILQMCEGTCSVSELSGVKINGTPDPRWIRYNTQTSCGGFFNLTSSDYAFDAILKVGNDPKNTRTLAGTGPTQLNGVCTLVLRNTAFVFNPSW